MKTTEKPKYKVIAEHIRRGIETGELGTAERLPSFTELRAQFGATPTTANQVYGVLEQQGLIVREPGRGIFVARRLVPQKANTIGIVGSAFELEHEMPYWSYLVEGVRCAAAQAGVEILLYHDEHPAPGWEKADGVLMCSKADQMFPALPPGMPCVSLITPASQVPSVIANDHKGARLAAEHLLELGHRRIGMLLSQPEHPISASRLEGYRAALWEAGIAPQTNWVRAVGEEAWQGCTKFDALGRAQMEHWLREDWRELGCTALLTHNDEMAIGVIETLQEAGLRVPEDTSVVGFDGTRLGEYFRPRLTSVEVPLRQIGARGVELLLAQIRGEIIPAKSEVLPVQLVVRSSTSKI